MQPRLLGNFQLLEQLGAGAFGTVWKARDTELDRLVAIKVPRRGQLDERETEQFVKEARAAAQLKHQNIVGVHEVGRSQDSIFIVSDYVQGATLSEWMGGEPLPPREAAELTARIADALSHAHQRGVIHRDLKPSNIMMNVAGEPFVTDFGLAKRESGEVTMTLDGAILGTPAYMSPEQAQGKSHEADARSDVYSLGVILFQMLTGELPFRGENRMLIVQILRDDPPRLRNLNSRIARDLETITLKCMEKSPPKRFPDTVELSKELRRWLAGEPIRSRPIGRIQQAWRWGKRNPNLAALIATAILFLALLAVGGTWIGLQQRQFAVRLKAEQDRRTQTLIDSLRSVAPQSVPFFIQTLELSRETALPELEAVFRSETTDIQHRLHIAMALAQLGTPSPEVVTFLVDQIAAADPGECPNLIAALRQARQLALKLIDEQTSQASTAKDWSRKSRLAIVALHLQDTAPAVDMLRIDERPDPIQRTVFIESFPQWHGELSELAELANSIEMAPSVRSGLCLAVGGISNPIDEARSAWEVRFSDWFQTQRDSATHSAAGWALRQWNLNTPQVSPTPESNGKQWFMTTSGLTMVQIPSGEFIRVEKSREEQSDGTPQTVLISRDFYLSDREITVGLFREFVEDDTNGNRRPGNWPGAARQFSPTNEHPVQQVSWYDAVLFCNWLSRREGRRESYVTSETAAGGWSLAPDADGFHLPSEAQWEYACRAGSETAFSFGEDESRLVSYAVFRVNSNSHTLPVGSKPCNSWGLFDMHGNVYEWCQDWSDGYGAQEQVKDPLGPDLGQRKVLRGGGWYGPAKDCRVWRRLERRPTDRNDNLGFRVALPGVSRP